MTTPKRKCKDCGAVGKWKVYLIWDAERDIKIGKRKHWLCTECDKKTEEIP